MIIKVCCINSIAEAQMAVNHGASALGLVGPMPSGPGIISITKAAEITAAFNQLVNTFYLTSKTSLDEILQEYDTVLSTHIQLTDYTSAQLRKDLKSHRPELKIVQVVHVSDQNSVDTAKSLSQFSDYLLLDSGSPNKNIKELGGTGRVHNWGISKKIVEVSNIPVFLAGGLNHENVSEAIGIVRPFGVDLCSGLRTEYKLDPIKIKAFFKSLKS